jgi:hypothetical protein
MIWRRTTLAVGIMCLCSVAGAVPPAHSEPARYRLQIKPSGPPTARSVVLICAEDVVCRGRIELMIDGRLLPMIAIALFEPGNAFIKFASKEIRLFVGVQPYVHIPLGWSRLAKATLIVNEPTALAVEDMGKSLYRRPVTRMPARWIADIDIDIRPGD